MLFGCRLFHILRGLFRVNDVYCVLCHVILLHCRMPTFLTVIKYSVSS